MTFERAKQPPFTNDGSTANHQGLPEIDIQEVAKKHGLEAFRLRDVPQNPTGLQEAFGGFRAGTLLMISGRPGVSKSQLINSVATIIAVGRDYLRLFVDRDGEPKLVRGGPVVILSLEDPKEEIERRLSALRLRLRKTIESGLKVNTRDGELLTKQDLDTIEADVIVIGPKLRDKKNLYTRDERGEPTRTEFFNSIIKLLQDIQPVAVFIDTFRRCKGPFAETDEPMMQMMASDLEAWAQEIQAIVGLVHHTVKSEEDRDDDMMAASGSGALAGSMRGMIAVRRVFDQSGLSIDDHALIVSAKNNYDAPFQDMLVEKFGGYVSPWRRAIKWFKSRQDPQIISHLQAEKGKLASVAKKGSWQ